MDPGKAAVSWQALGFTPRAHINCGEPGKYIYVKCKILQTAMELTGESDPQHLDEHKHATFLEGSWVLSAPLHTPGLLLPQRVSSKELVQCKEKLTSLLLYNRTMDTT